MNKGILLLLIIILVGGYWWWSGSQEEVVVDETAGTQLAGEETPIVDADGNELIGGDAVAGDLDDPALNLGDAATTPEADEEPAAVNEVSFDVLGGNFYFDLKEIKVKEGDKVTINFKSVEGFHDWVVDEFNAATAQVRTDGTTSVTFVADKKGTYEYYCSVGSHRAQGMVGNLVVE